MTRSNTGIFRLREMKTGEREKIISEIVFKCDIGFANDLVEMTESELEKKYCSGKARMAFLSRRTNVEDKLNAAFSESGEGHSPYSHRGSR